MRGEETARDTGRGQKNIKKKRKKRPRRPGRGPTPARSSTKAAEIRRDFSPKIAKAAAGMGMARARRLLPLLTFVTLGMILGESPSSAS